MVEAVTPDLATIIDILRNHRQELQQKYSVRELGVFGSYVRGEQTAGSDVDILIEFGPDTRIGLFGFVELKDHLSDLLGVNVDLVERAALKPAIGKHVLEEVVRL